MTKTLLTIEASSEYLAFKPAAFARGDRQAANVCDIQLLSPGRGGDLIAHGASRGKPGQEREPSPDRGDSDTVAHTYTNLVIHALFRTKNREPWIDNEMKDELFAYLGGIVTKLGARSLLVNGVEDHVHALLVQPADVPLADLMEKVKANSSGWVKRRWPGRSKFAWQSGYAAFSVSQSQVEQVRKYIEGQEEHHRKVSFQEEVLAFLKKNGVVYDPRYVFG